MYRALIILTGSPSTKENLDGTLSAERTYKAAIPQWAPASLPAELKRGRATREMVGAMVKGPMKRMR